MATVLYNLNQQQQHYDNNKTQLRYHQLLFAVVSKQIYVNFKVFEIKNCFCELCWTANDGDLISHSLTYRPSTESQYVVEEYVGLFE